MPDPAHAYQPSPSTSMRATPVGGQPATNRPQPSTARASATMTAASGPSRPSGSLASAATPSAAQPTIDQRVEVVWPPAHGEENPVRPSCIAATNSVSGRTYRAKTRKSAHESRAAPASAPPAGTQHPRAQQRGGRRRERRAEHRGKTRGPLGSRPSAEASAISQ